VAGVGEVVGVGVDMVVGVWVGEVAGVCVGEVVGVGVGEIVGVGVGEGLAWLEHTVVARARSVLVWASEESARRTVDSRTL